MVQNINNYFGSSESFRINTKPVILQWCLIYSGIALFVSLATNFPNILTNDIECELPPGLHNNRGYYSNIWRNHKLYSWSASQCRDADERDQNCDIPYFNILLFISFFICLTDLLPWIHDAIENGSLKVVLEEPKITSEIERQKLHLKGLYHFVQSSELMQSHFFISFIFECIQIWALTI